MNKTRRNGVHKAPTGNVLYKIIRLGTVIRVIPDYDKYQTLAVLLIKLVTLGYTNASGFASLLLSVELRMSLVKFEDALGSTLRTFPVDVEVVKGLERVEHSNAVSLLRTGSLIRILFAASEPAFRCQTEPDDRSFSIPLNCPYKLELLQPDAILDDQTYETACDVLQAPVRPSWVRVQSGHRGRQTMNTIDVDEVLEDLRPGTNDRGEATLCANRFLQTDPQEKLKERAVVLSLDTVGMFTTTSASEDRYLPIQLAEKWTRVPQRVRIHSDTCAPLKTRILKLEEQKVAVCVDLKSRQRMAIPASSETHVRVIKEYPISSRLSKSLHKMVNISTLPRIESLPLEDQSQSNDSLMSDDQLAVLFPPNRDPSLSTDYLCHYETLVQHPQMFGMSSGPIKKTGSLPQSNLISRHRNICTVLSHAKLLTENSTMIKIEDDADDDDDYELPGYELVDKNHKKRPFSETDAGSSMMKSDDVDDDDYELPLFELVDRNHKKTAFSESDTGSSMMKSEHDVDEDDYELPGYQLVEKNCGRPQSVSVSSKNLDTKLRTHHEGDDNLTRHYTRLTRSQSQTKHTPYTQVATSFGDQVKLDRVRTNNLALQKNIRSLEDRLHYLKSLDTESAKESISSELISSLSCTEILTLLENIGLGVYKQNIIDEQLEGYLLYDCSRDFLIDVGMRPAHACKFLALLKGRLPLRTTWTELVGKRNP